MFKRLQAPEEKPLIPLTIINLPKAGESRLKLLVNVILWNLATVNSSTVGTELPPLVLHMSTIPRFLYSVVILSKSVTTIYAMTT